MNTAKKLKELQPLLMDKYAECQSIFSKETGMGHPRDENVIEAMHLFIELIRTINKL